MLAASIVVVTSIVASVLGPIHEDMAMLYAPPRPACPPHCTPPVPRYSEVNCTFVKMELLSSHDHIDDYGRTGSYLCSPASVQAKGGAGRGSLLLFFTGTAPSDNTLFIQTAALLGFHAVALSYNNEGAPNGECSDYPTNQTIFNDHCEFDVEEERLFGGNRSATLWQHRAQKYQLVNPANSIMSRIELLLKYAAKHQLTGSDHWASFLIAKDAVTTADPLSATASAPSGQGVNWTQIVLSGWSRGSAYPVHITKYFKVSSYDHSISQPQILCGIIICALCFSC